MRRMRRGIANINALLPDVVILDLKLQSGSGVSVLKNIKKHHAGVNAIKGAWLELLSQNFNEPFKQCRIQTAALAVAISLSMRGLAPCYN